MSSKRLVGWLVAVQGPKNPQQRLYAAVAQQKAYPSLEHETGHAEALVGDHLSATNEQVEFQRRLTDSEIARLRLKAGEVKRKMNSTDRHLSASGLAQFGMRI